MLMHAVEVRNQYPNRPPSNGSERIANGTSTHVNDHTPVPDLDLIVGEQEYKHAISHCEEAKANNLEGSQAGAVWDVFRRQDLPKLNEYLAAHREEFGANCQAVPSVMTPFFCIKLFSNIFSNVFHDNTFPMQVKYPIYDQNVYLNNHHKKTLKDQYGKY
jgi:[histone H3]-dimethyl-L-lysine9 demethylase